MAKMRILNTMRRQFACYWAPTGGVDDFGQPLYTGVEELRVRWEDVAEEFISKTGQTSISRSKISYVEPLHVDGILWQGRKNGLTSETVPFQNAGAREIQRVAIIPTLSAKEQLVLAYL